MSIGSRSISQETPSESFPLDQKEFLARRFIDIGNSIDRIPEHPERKQMPLKPQFGNVYYFGDPALHSYDAVIDEQGFWGFVEILPSTDPKTGEWLLLSPSNGRFEQIIMRKDTLQSAANGETILLYDDAIVEDARATLEYDLALGTITIGKTGWYDIHAYVECTGSNNQDFYGLYVNSGGTLFFVGSVQWNNLNPALALEASLSTILTAGTVMFMYAFASGGTLDVTRARFSITYQQGTNTV